MASKPLTSEAIALTEKKVDMSLDDIIKLSKKTRNTKPKNQRLFNRGQKPFNNVSQDKGLKLKRFMDTRSSLRQGALARRRSNIQGNQFPLATEAAKKAAFAPIRNQPFNRSRPFNINKSRVGASAFQKNAATGAGPNVKKSSLQEKPVQQAFFGSKQKPLTLDSLFANMKEQRMRELSRLNNKNGPRGNGGRYMQQQQPGLPWARGGFMQH